MKLRPPPERRVGGIKRYPDETYVERRRGAELIGWRYNGPSTTCPPPTASSIASSVGPRSRWMGHRHRAHRTGVRHRDFELSRATRPSLSSCRWTGGPILRSFGWLHGLDVESTEGSWLISPSAPSGRVRMRTAIRSAGAVTRRSSSALPMTGSSPSTSAAETARRERDCGLNAGVLRQGGRLARNMGEVSRRRYFGLPCRSSRVPGHVAVIVTRRARGAGDRRHGSAHGAHRQWLTPFKSAASLRK